MSPSVSVLVQATALILQEPVVQRGKARVIEIEVSEYEKE
jgi:hypothetical protein